MNTPKQDPRIADCDLQRIRDFVNSDHYHLEDANLIAHLDECPPCRQYLEAEAGEPERWEQATRLLRKSEFDDAGLIDFSAAPGPGTNAGQSVAVQDVLDLLVPSEYPNHLGRLGTYEVTGVVGVGGMGVVLKAIDPSLDRVIALKVMSPSLAHNENARKRFAREAKAAAAVLHPNVVPIHSVSSGTTLPYLVMSYIRGGSLQKRLDQEGTLPLVAVLRIGSQIAAGLAAAHEQGLIHRDIKPENILLEDGVERVTITDFGLARSVDDNTITQFGCIAGTPQYMSPEQARGEYLDQQSDLFSLGSLLYTLCTGRPPFRDETSYGVMRKIIDEEPASIEKLSSEIPSWMAAIVGKLMAKKKRDRFASAREVRELLEACLSHVQQPSSHPVPLKLLGQFPPVRKQNRMKLLIGTGFILFAVLTAFAGQLMLTGPARTDPTVETPLMAQFRAAERITDRDQSDLAFAELAGNAVQVGDITMTTRALEHIVRKELESSTRRDCAIATFQLGKHAAAHTLAESIYYQHDRDDALLAFVQAGGPEATAATKAESKKALEKTPDDQANIQGHWRVVFAEDSGRASPQESLRDIRFVINQETMTMEFAGRKNESTYKLNPSTNPKSIDMTENGRTKLGIYDLQGNTLRICMSEDKPLRPTAFDSQPGSVNDLVLTLKRMIPEPPSTETTSETKPTATEAQTQDPSE